MVEIVDVVVVKKRPLCEIDRLSRDGDISCHACRSFSQDYSNTTLPYFQLLKISLFVVA